MAAQKPIPDKQVLSLALSGELLQQVDDYRFRHRFNTRLEAIRYLIDYALSKNPAPGQDGAPLTRADLNEQMLIKMLEG